MTITKINYKVKIAFILNSLQKLNAFKIPKTWKKNLGHLNQIKNILMCLSTISTFKIIVFRYEIPVNAIYS